MADPQVLLQPTDIVVDQIKITSTTENKTIDITDLVQGIDINEAIYTPVLTGVILVIDAAGVLAELPIVGQEKIEFTVTRPGPDGYEKEFTFYVRSIENVERQNDFTNLYQLRIVEEAYYWNALSPISQSFKGSIDTIITEIVETYLRTTIETTPTSGAFQFVIPGWRPYDTISWLVNRARSEDNDPFFLWNTLFDGLKFASVRDLYEAEPEQNRTVYTNKENIPESKKDAKTGADAEIKDRLDMAMLFESVRNTPTAENILDGAFGADYILLDTLQKTVNTLEWNYAERFDSLPKLSKHKVISDKKKYDDIDVSGYKTGDIIFAYSSSAFEAPSHMSYNEDALNIAPFKNHVESMMSNYIYKIALPGDNKLQVGKTINLYIPKNVLMSKDTESEVQDQRRSGKHFITAVKHRFHLIKNQYTQMIEVNRDTMERDHDDAN